MRQALLISLCALFFAHHSCVRADDNIDMAFSLAGMLCTDPEFGGIQTPESKKIAETPVVSEYMKHFRQDFPSCLSARKWVTPAMCHEFVKLDYGKYWLPGDDTAKLVIEAFQQKYRAQLEEVTGLMDCINAEEARTRGQKR